MYYIVEDGNREKDAWIYYLEVILVEQWGQKTNCAVLRSEWWEQETPKQANILEKEKLD